MNDVNLHELFNRIANDDETAFRELYNTWYDPIVTTALVYGKSEEMARDVCQQVFLEIWQRRNVLSNVKDPEAWLISTARYQTFHSVKKELQKNNYLKLISRAEHEPIRTPEENFVLNERAAIINEVLSQLSSRQQLIYRMGREEGFTYAEISEKLQLGHETVKAHMATALKAIRTALLRRKNDLISILVIYLLFF